MKILLRICSGCLAVCLIAFVLASSAFATPPTAVVPAETETNSAPGLTGFLTGINRSAYLLGDMWGLRTLLSKYGLSLAVSETSEVLGNVSGGVKQGFDYDGLTQMILQMDTDRAFHLYGGTFNVSGLQIHGSNLSARNLASLQTASGIEADDATRLWELWYQQKFLAEDRLDVKLGQQSLDQEFMVSQNAGLFVNTMFGWPMLPSADLPGGGPAYPLSALGVRVRAHPSAAVTVLAGVFNGSPVANTSGDSQRHNPSGTSFPLNGGVLAIAEIQYAYPSVGSMVYAAHTEPLSRVYRLGFWYNTGRFADQRFDNTGLSLANPLSTGIPETHHDDYAFYAVVDQMVWRDSDDPEGDRAVNLFIRAMGTPVEDRNLIDFSLNAGLTFHELIPHRSDDTCGLGMGYTKVGDHAAGLDKDTGIFTNGFYPVRSGETYVEATYQCQITPWWQIQPDFQYVFNPGGGVANPNASGQRVKDEAVIGVRTNIFF